MSQVDPHQQRVLQDMEQHISAKVQELLQDNIDIAAMALARPMIAVLIHRVAEAVLLGAQRLTASIVPEHANIDQLLTELEDGLIRRCRVRREEVIRESASDRQVRQAEQAL